MKDFLIIIGIVVGTYVCFIGFTLILMRLFFPLKTNAEMEALENAQAKQRIPKALPVSLPQSGGSQQLA
jgi:hypothetical protein